MSDGRRGTLGTLTAMSVAYGAVEGRVHAISNRRGLRMTVYDHFHDVPVACHLSDDRADFMREAWGLLVRVEGRLTRDTAGRPVAMHDVTRVEVVDPGEPGAWRRAMGALKGMTDEPAEVTIRRFRDAG